MSQELVYNVDMVLCIDRTGSMSPIIDVTKKEAIRFVEETKRKLDAEGKKVNQLRIKIIYFGDYWVDGTDAMAESGFFTLPSQNSEYEAFLDKPLVGGGDEPESALEAMVLGMKSDWVSEGKTRHIIVMYTDATPHPLDKADKPAHYPEGMPKNFSELLALWEGQDTGLTSASKRLFLFAPETEAWNNIYENFPNTIHLGTKGGAGLADISLDDVIDQIVASV